MFLLVPIAQEMWALTGLTVKACKTGLKNRMFVGGQDILNPARFNCIITWLKTGTLWMF